MSARPVDRKGYHDIIILGIGIALGVGLRRWKGDTFESNLRTQLAMQVGLAVGYFLVADSSNDET